METLLTDVTVLGGGPGGCAAAILLAQAGLKVVLLEKSRFPRFRIGESLLPNSRPILRRLGVWDKLDDAGFLRKYGAEFTVSDGSQRVHNRFDLGMLPDCGYAYQVERSKFDQLLLDHAMECGCEVLQETAAHAVDDLGDAWETRAESMAGSRTLRIRSRWIIDATGRESFLAKRFQIEREPLPYPKRLAIYAHYEGIALQPEERSGNIIITRLSDGWFWNIPLGEHLTSLGVVASLERYRTANVSPEEFFDSELKRSAYLTDVTRAARRAGPVRVTTDYSFMYRNFAGPRYLLVGDAAAFVDPVFSSGVYLAMDSAGRAVDLLLQAEGQSRALTSVETTQYTSKLKKSIGVMRKLIEMFYDDDGFAVFLHPTDRLKLASAVNAVVAGNTDLPFGVWWRFQLFLLICRLNRRFHFIRTKALEKPAGRPPEKAESNIMKRT
ncbi:MAG: NAD(P)/FAD-dependent oxidoreductase [Opitutales bacterium]